VSEPSEGDPGLRRRATLQALLVTTLWSSSWVLIKLGLAGMPPILFAGIRYSLAAILLAATLTRTEVHELLASSRRDVVELLGLGTSLYFFTQGAQFVSLAYFPAVVPALILNLVPVLVAVTSLPLLGERPRPLQLGGIALCALGTWLFFAPKLGAGLALDWRLAIPTVGLAANAVAALLGRSINRKRRLSAKLVTVVSMGSGSLTLLGLGALIEPAPTFTARSWAILGWLVVVNTAFAFTLWNKTLRTLSSVESSVINNTMLAQIAILAWAFLGESLGARDVGVLAVVMAGVLLVQVKRQARAPA
jgi:drug/metabolite transporter (DMT)-like permease